LAVLEHAEEGLVDRGFGEGFLVLKLRGKIDAVVFTDVADGLWRKFLSLWRYAHGIEDGSTGLKISTEGTGGYIGQLGQGTFAYKAVFIVKVDHN
jgi:hypothetical protein